MPVYYKAPFCHMNSEDYTYLLFYGFETASYKARAVLKFMTLVPFAPRAGATGVCQCD